MWFLSLLFLCSVLAPIHGCQMANWWRSFDHKGYSNCGSSQYINGLWRNDNAGMRSDDRISRIEQARCCSPPRPYRNMPTNSIISDWILRLDKNNRWAECPHGYFLRGLYRSDDSWIHNIEYGKCSKPANHPYWWGHCYEHSVYLSFDNKGLSKCNDNYFMTGIYRGGCDRLYCIEKFKCCKMYPSPPALKSLSDVKTRVMDLTMSNFAMLANYLGYGWCASCRANYVGEDFRRNADSWEADRKGPCSGYKNDHRLKMHYGHFKFGIKNIRYGNPVTQSLAPESYLTGRVSNSDSTPVKHTVERVVGSVRTVTHTITSSWKVAHELGIEISYTPPGVFGGIGGKISYKFNYESSHTTTDSTSNQQHSSIKVKSEKTLAPHTAASYRIMLTKTRTTVPYTATIIAHFSAEMDGFLRWGGGYNGGSTNYHYQHRGSSRRPTFKYRFGDANKPFYTALKEQSDRNMRPWLWHDVKAKYGSAQSLVNILSDERMYEFTLTGQFEDVIGQHADVQWKTVSLNGRKRRASDEMFPDVPSEDPPRLFPKPPKVVIKPGKNENIPLEKVSGN